MALSAVDCIARGLVNLRANWELILVQILQILLVTLLTLVGFLPPLAVLGWTNWEVLDPAIDDWTVVMESVSSVLARGREAWILLLASLVLASVIWLIAMLVYCYFQGGIYAILRNGDRQAPPGNPRGWRWFRTYSTRDLRGFSALYLWRYFGLINLLLLFSLALIFLPLVLAFLMVWGQARWGTPAALGIGCGGAIPVLFSFFVMIFWSSLAQADLAQENSGVRDAARRGLKVLGRRLGTLMFFFVLGAFLMLSWGVVVGIASFTLGFLSGSSPAVQTTISLLLTLMEWLMSSVMSVSFASILISLMRSESMRGVVP